MYLIGRGLARQGTIPAGRTPQGWDGRCLLAANRRVGRHAAGRRASRSPCSRPGRDMASSGRERRCSQTRRGDAGLPYTRTCLALFAGHWSRHGQNSQQHRRPVFLWAGRTFYTRHRATAASLPYRRGAGQSSLYSLYGRTARLRERDTRRGAQKKNPMRRRSLLPRPEMISRRHDGGSNRQIDTSSTRRPHTRSHSAEYSSGIV